MRKFSTSIALPEYLEDALAPFSWSGVFSDKFRTDIICAIVAHNRLEACSDLAEAIGKLDFLSGSYQCKLVDALKRFGREGFRNEQS